MPIPIIQGVVLPRRFIFMRHGRTAWNARGVVMGQHDVPLDAVGRAQAEEAAALVAERPVTSLWVSPLARCRDTAAAVSRCRPGLAVTVLDGLQERHWGVFQGGPAGARPPRAETPDGGESAAAFAARTMAALATVAEDDGLPVVVAHSGTFRTLLDHLGCDGDVTIPNAAPCLVQPGAELPVMPLAACPSAEKA